MSQDITIKALTDEQARQFEKVEMPFGKHKGFPIHEVDLNYLLWLDDQPDFRLSLKRYLASNRVQSQL